MTNGQRTVTTMLAVVAVMLGLNLIVRGSPTAVAQGPRPQQPTIVAGSVEPGCGTNPTYVYRHWSDGMVDVTRVQIDLTGACIPDDVCLPPVVVIPGI